MTASTGLSLHPVVWRLRKGETLEPPDRWRTMSRRPLLHPIDSVSALQLGLVILAEATWGLFHAAKRAPLSPLNDPCAGRFALPFTQSFPPSFHFQRDRWGKCKHARVEERLLERQV